MEVYKLLDEQNLPDSKERYKWLYGWEPGKCFLVHIVSYYLG